MCSAAAAKPEPVRNKPESHKILRPEPKPKMSGPILSCLSTGRSLRYVPKEWMVLKMLICSNGICCSRAGCSFPMSRSRRILNEGYLEKVVCIPCGLCPLLWRIRTVPFLISCRAATLETDGSSDSVLMWRHIEHLQKLQLAKGTAPRDMPVTSLQCAFKGQPSHRLRQSAKSDRARSKRILKQYVTNETCNSQDRPPSTCMSPIHMHPQAPAEEVQQARRSCWWFAAGIPLLCRQRGCPRRETNSAFGEAVSTTSCR